jgi:hypothetical protein
MNKNTNCKVDNFNVIEKRIQEVKAVNHNWLLLPYFHL